MNKIEKFIIENNEKYSTFHLAKKVNISQHQVLEIKKKFNIKSSNKITRICFKCETNKCFINDKFSSSLCKDCFINELENYSTNNFGLFSKIKKEL